jgi:Secretion system C-terminal sorting domain
MQKFYPAVAGKLCLVLLFSCLFISFANAQIRTYDTTFDGWNAIVTEDLSLHGNDSAPGIVFFPGIGEQTKNINDLQKNGPHYLIKNGMWDGSVPLGNGIHHPFIISLQPPDPDNPAMYVKPKIDAILARYRIKRKSFYFTGLSLGAWQANEFVTYQPTTGDHTYGNMVKAIVNLEGVEPADYTGIYAGLPYPQKMGDWAKACGGKELWVEGSQDWRDMLVGAQNMTAAVAGSATYFQVTYGGGAHCCWNTEYTPSVTWTAKSNSNISQVVGNEVPMSVWQWLLRQGDTTMPSGASGPSAVVPTAAAGSAQAITLPVNSVNLAGSGTTYNGAKVSAMSWTQTSGPNNSSIKAGNLVSTILSTVSNIIGAITGTANSLSASVSGLIAGTYTFQLSIKDNNGLSSTSSVTVTVKAAAAPAPPPAASKPNVSAGPPATVTLPNTTATLKATAAGSNGAKIAGVLWQQSEGPVVATIAVPTSLSTNITGLKAAGTYVFRLTVTDQNGKQAASVVNVVVNPAAATAPQVAPTVSAGKGQAVMLPASSVLLTGVATGNGGATIKGLTWKQVQGPVTGKIGSPASLSTAVSGLTKAGSYVFQLVATESNGLQGTGSITVTVNPAPVTKEAPSVNAGKGQAVTLPTSSVVLTGVATGNGGATIKGLTWKQVQGPVTSKIGSPASLSTSVSGLTTAGSYVFQLVATESNGLQGSGSMTVTVKAAPVVSKPAESGEAEGKGAPPTVSAGEGLAIELPTSSVTLKGVATGNDGATIKGLTWNQVQGPVTTKIGSYASISTAVTGLTTAGSYVFMLTATDNNGRTANGSITITVEAAAVKTAPTVSAGGNMTITLPTSSVVLNGVATGHNGAAVNSYFWNIVSGPSYVKFSDEWASTTTVSGLVAGTYVFQFAASDPYETSAASMTLVVKPKTSPASVAGGVQAGDAAMTDPALADSIDHISGLVIYPNPVRDLLNIHLNNGATGKIVVAIFNMKGARMESRELDKESWSLEASIDVSRLPAGVYVIEAMSSKGVRTVEKFIKQ